MACLPRRGHTEDVNVVMTRANQENGEKVDRVS